MVDSWRHNGRRRSRYCSVIERRASSDLLRGFPQGMPLFFTPSLADGSVNMATAVLFSYGGCGHTRTADDLGSECGFEMQDKNKVRVVLMLLLALVVAALVIYRIAATLP